MTRVHTEVMAALLPFCKNINAGLSLPVSRPAGGATEDSRVGKLAAYLGTVDYPEEVIESLKGNALLNQREDRLRIIDAAVTRYRSDEADEQAGCGCSGSAVNYPVGSVVVVVAGKERHKRVLNRGYLIVEGGTSPLPLGLRGLGERNRPRFQQSDIRLASLDEVSVALSKLTAAQVQALVCYLASIQPWKQALSGVIENNQSFCSGRSS